MKILLGGMTSDAQGVRAALPTHAVTVDAETADELVESVFACSPDLALVCDDMPTLWPALRKISATLPVPVILIVAQAQDHPSDLLDGTDVFALVNRPVTPHALRQACLVASTQFQRLASARTEAAELREAFAARKIIDRAKGILMQRRSCSEGEAYTLLREESRSQRTPIVDIAKSILSAAESAGDAGRVHATLAVAGTRRTIGTMVERNIRE